MLLINKIPDIEIKTTETNNPYADGLWWSVYGTFNFEDRPSLIATASSLEDVISLTFQVIKLRDGKETNRHT